MSYQELVGNLVVEYTQHQGHDGVTLSVAEVRDLASNRRWISGRCDSRAKAATAVARKIRRGERGNEHEETTT